MRNWTWLTNDIRKGMGLLPILASIGFGGCSEKEETEGVDTASNVHSDTGENDTGDQIDPNECGSYPEITSADYPDNFETGTHTLCGPLPADESVCPPVSEITGSTFVTDNLGPVSDPELCWWEVDNNCGPIESITDRCCYELVINLMCKGRPYSVDGKALLANIIPSDDWPQRLPIPCAELSAKERGFLRKEWTLMAQQEHASIASFARFVLQIISLGAPPDLIQQSNRAMQDELLHAKLVFGIASALAGKNIGVGEMNMGEPQQLTKAEILESVILEGCIVETITVAQMSAAQNFCSIQSIRGVLYKIVEDESRHAALAWQFVQWMLSSHPELLPIAQQAFLKAEQAILAPKVGVDPIDQKILKRYGRLPVKEQREISIEVWKQVITPNKDALLHKKIAS